MNLFTSLGTFAIKKGGKKGKKENCQTGIFMYKKDTTEYIFFPLDETVVQMEGPEISLCLFIL